ncbi:hypothetical protein BaRGS_00012878 [Batillaria attramentaria]|uniref:Uncharacterized protein n=1 Tax=Batillaria attramentaria TaxID=370345 RepID=A0ABD0L9D6_9CAEN
MSKSASRNGKTSSQDYMNLLYSDSESDTVPDLRLPPLKGKKPKRSRRRNAESESICSPWIVLNVVTVIVLLAAMVTLGVITYWALQQIRELKDQINNFDVCRLCTFVPLVLVWCLLKFFQRSG